MGAPTALPPERPGRREEGEAAGPCPPSGRRGALRAPRTEHPAAHPAKGAAPGPHLPPYLLPGGLSALGRRVPGTRRRPAACPPAAPAPGPRPARRRPLSPRPAPPARPPRQRRRGGPGSNNFPPGRGPHPRAAPGARPGSPLTRRRRGARGWGPGAAAPSLLSALRAPPDWLGPSSPPPSARRQPAPSLPPSSSSRRGPSPAEQRPSPTREARPRAAAGPGLGVGLRPGESRGARRGAAPCPAPPRPGPGTPAPAAPAGAPRRRRCGLLQPLSLRWGAMQPLGDPGSDPRGPQGPGGRGGAIPLPHPTRLPLRPVTSAWRTPLSPHPSSARGLPHSPPQPHGQRGEDGVRAPRPQSRAVRPPCRGPRPSAPPGMGGPPGTPQPSPPPLGRPRRPRRHETHGVSTSLPPVAHVPCRPTLEEPTPNFCFVKWTRVSSLHHTHHPRSH